MNSAPIHPVDELDEDDDDRLIGRIMSRREVLALFGAGGVALTLAGCAPDGSISGSTAPNGTASASAGVSASPATGATASPPVGGAWT